MTAEKEIEVIKNLDEGLMKILESKRHDYATDDVLSNFKRLSSVAKQLQVDIGTPTGYALFMVLLKIDRINNLIKSGKKPSNESIEDSFADGINYFKLAYCNHLEEMENNVKS